MSQSTLIEHGWPWGHVLLAWYGGWFVDFCVAPYTPILSFSPRATKVCVLGGGGGGFGMLPWCNVLVCSRRRLLAYRRSRPFPWTLSLQKRWCPLASHHPVSFLFLFCPIFPSLLPFPFPWSLVPLDFPCFTALCQVHTEEGNCPRRWLGVSKRSSQPGGEGPLPNSGFWAPGCPLAGSFPRHGHITTFCLSVPALRPPCGERIMYPLPPTLCPWYVY